LLKQHGFGDSASTASHNSNCTTNKPFCRRNSNFFFVTTAVKSCSFGSSASTTDYDSSCNNKQSFVREEPSPGSNDTVVESVIA